MDLDVDYGKIDEFEDDISAGLPEITNIPEPEKRDYQPSNWDERKEWEDMYDKMDSNKMFDFSVKLFYDKISKLYKLIDYDEFKKNFRIWKHGSDYSLYVKLNNKEIEVTKEFNHKKIWFYSLTEIAKEYNNKYVSGGVEAIKKEFGLKYLDKKMAEGYGFKNPTYLDDYSEDTPIDENAPTDEDTPLFNENTPIDDIFKPTTLSDDEEQLVDWADQKIKLAVDNYYDFLLEKYNLIPSNRNYFIFKVEPDGTLYLIANEKQIKVTKAGGFIALETLRKNIGPGAIEFIRTKLGLEEYEYGQTGKFSVKQQLAMKDIELKALKAKKELEKPIEMENINSLDEVVQEIETSFFEITHSTIGTQTTGFPLRELQGLDKALQSTRGELVNNLAKLSYIDKDLTKEKQKLAQINAGEIDSFDGYLRNKIEDRIKNLEDERSARLEAASANKEALRSQVSRIRETIKKVLNEDTTLAEKIKTLFKEQGITIASVLTAFGMIIGLIVETLTGGGGATSSPAPSPAPSPSDKGGVKEWIKKQLTNLGKLLASLAEKAAAALPGIIGSIVSWLLNTAGKVVTYAANNLWVLVVFVGGLLLAEAKKYLK